MFRNRKARRRIFGVRKLENRCWTEYTTCGDGGDGDGGENVDDARKCVRSCRRKTAKRKEARAGDAEERAGDVGVKGRALFVTRGVCGARSGERRNEMMFLSASA